MSDITHNAAGTGVPRPEPILPTLDEFLNAYSEQPVEVINGELVPLHPPDLAHSRIAHRLLILLAVWVIDHDLGEAFTETAFVLDGSETRDWVRYSRIPDVAYVAKDRAEEHDRKFPEGGPWRLAPDIAVEVISPNDRYQDVDDKIAEYLFYGVKLVVIINPRKRTVRMITPENQEGTILTDKDILSFSPLVEGWSMPVAELFAKRKR